MEKQWRQWPVINELAEALEVSAENRRKWKFRGFVPDNWHYRIMAMAKRRRKRLSAKALRGNGA